MPPSPLRSLSHVVGIDDAPFDAEERGAVAVVGAVYANLRLEGVLRSRVRRDGADATRALAAMIGQSRFSAHLQAVLLQGITLAGFNVVDLRGLSGALELPVLAVVRRKPDLEAVERALRQKVPGGARKWRLVEAAGPPERVGEVWVQRAGLSLEEAGALVTRLAVHGKLPEPLRVAHLIAGALGRGQSRGGA